jgi:predicted ATP-grasp superfamily ATP-dependent carboligase
MKAMKRVLVTDGSYRNALAAVRTLGAHGWSVTVAERDSIPRSQVVAAWSRYCARSVRYPDPRERSDVAVASMRSHFGSTRYDAVIPIGLDMVEFFVRHAEELRAPVMLASEEAFAIAADKRRTFDHARGIGIPIPATVPALRWKELQAPLVFKHPRAGAEIIRTESQAAARLAAMNGERDRWLAQEFIPGENGFGYFGFFVHGVECGYFMHERLVQYPREGGPSVVARSIRNERLHELGRTVLESLRWHGVAMVEFKRSDRDGEFYLIEINPKFWGSLDLAIAAGANFPLWVARTLAEDAAPTTEPYIEGVTFQWVLPVGIKSFARYPRFRSAFVRNVLSPYVKTDLRLLEDPLPTAAGIMGLAARGLQS